MNLLAISGSLRKGNTEILVDKIIKGATESNIEAEHIILRTLNFKRDCASDDCFHIGKCKINDMLTSTLEKIKSTDYLVLATPNYFNNVSGLMKDFIDRTNPYVKNSDYSGVNTILVVVGGYSKFSNKKCESILKDFCNIHKMKVIHSINAIADKKNEILDQKSLLENCYKLGKSLKI